MKQISFALNLNLKKTFKCALLEQMARVTPWTALWSNSLPRTTQRVDAAGHPFTANHAGQRPWQREKEPRRAAKTQEFATLEPEIPSS
ncbi:hypothetical protein [Polaromonas sp. UBA4122]|uniref:hypothetical protein n=1 Tax=Polaromonas sp. UBA4122 TaxID=1947074 RepID=UPI0025D79BE5|nr:hypothetical protein [Polaromonas sp. UBA4122]